MPSRNCCTSIFNYTPGYVREELEEQPLVENPELRERKKQRAGLVSELNRLKIELADHLLEPPAKKRDRKSTRLNSSHVAISYAVFCLKKKTISSLLCEVDIRAILSFQDKPFTFRSLRRFFP